MRRRRAYGWVALAVAVLAAGTLVAIWSSAARVPMPTGALPVVTGGAPAYFISLRDWNRPLESDITLSSSTTGAPVRKLLPASLGGMTVGDLSLDLAGNLWITYSAGPEPTSKVAGGDPKPGSCNNEIVVWRKATRHVAVFLHTGHDVLIQGAILSPNRRLLAYTESDCASLGTDYVRVTAVASGRSWTIGRSLPRCHALVAASWTADSRSLLLLYAPSLVAHYSGSGGTCMGGGRSQLIEIDATARQARVAGRAYAADPGCGVNAVAAVADGNALAIEDCGELGSAGQSENLLLINSRLRLVRRIGLGHCAEVGGLSPDGLGTSVLVGGDVACPAASTHGPGPGPSTRLWLYTARGGLRLIMASRNELGISSSTW
jgi:hypothetical protein